MLYSSNNVYCIDSIISYCEYNTTVFLLFVEATYHELWRDYVSGVYRKVIAPVVNTSIRSGCEHMVLNLSWVTPSTNFYTQKQQSM